MSDAFWGGLFGFLGLLLTQYIMYLKMKQVSFEQSRQGVKQEFQSVKQQENATSLGELHDAIADVVKHTNGMKDELVAEVRKVSFAQGQKQGEATGLQQGRDEANSPDKR